LLKYENIYEWVNTTQVMKPDPKRVEIYERYFDMYKNVYKSLEECYESLSMITQ